MVGSRGGGWIEAEANHPVVPTLPPIKLDLRFSRIRLPVRVLCFRPLVAAWLLLQSLEPEVICTDARRRKGAYLSLPPYASRPATDSTVSGCACRAARWSATRIVSTRRSDRPPGKIDRRPVKTGQQGGNWPSSEVRWGLKSRSVSPLTFNYLFVRGSHRTAPFATG